MIPTLQLDPASLSLWFNVDLFGNYLGDDRGPQFFKDVTSGDLGNATAILDTITEPRLEAHYYQLASAVWHEKRHFLDFALTTWGASQVRAFFQLTLISTLVLRELQEDGHSEILCPLDVYDDPVQLYAARTKSPVSDRIRRAAAEVRRQKENIRSQNVFVTDDDSGHRLAVGGIAQMESLAYVCQIASLQYQYGTHAIDILNRFGALRNITDTQYLWLTVLAPQSTMSRLPNDLVEHNPAVPVAMAVAALCGDMSRGDALTQRGWGSQSPEARLADLLPEVPTAQLGDASDDEIWHSVDAACLKVFGRTVADEIRADVTAQCRVAENLERVVPGSPVSKAFNDYTALRERLAQRFAETPTAFTSAQGFFVISDEIMPFPILCSPRGSQTVPQDHEPLFGFDFSDVIDDPSASGWYAVTDAAHRRVSSTAIALDYTAGWNGLIRTQFPIAKLLMNGRRHRTMLGAELHDAENLLRRLNLQPRFMNGTARPADEVDGRAYRRFTGATRLKCDFTSAAIDTDSAVFISPWDMREQPYLDYMRAILGPLADFIVKKDWSHWATSPEIAERIRSQWRPGAPASPSEAESAAPTERRPR
jgi:hypothetical protein